MKKRSVFILGLLFSVFLISSCTKDDTMVSGVVSYTDVDDGQEYVTEGVNVYLMPEGTTDVSDCSAKTTTDKDGNYSFYPVNDGDYYIYSKFTDVSQLHTYSGKSETFTAKGKKNVVEDVLMK